MPSARSRILYQDDDLLIVDKIAGELTVAAESGGRSLLDELRGDLPGLRAVHRLDFGTSGVVVFAKTAQAEAAIRESKFAGWKKTYVTLVHGTPSRPTGTIRIALPARMSARSDGPARMSARSDGPARMSARSDGPARSGEDKVSAVTQYRTMQSFGRLTLVECVILTGRHHQIRRHLRAIGCPLVLDATYGDPRRDRAFKQRYRYRRMFLHAASVVFPHPTTGKTVTVSAPLPKSFQAVIAKLRGRGTAEKVR